MSKWVWLALFAAACTGGGAEMGDAGLDAPGDAAPDAGFPPVTLTVAPMSLVADGMATATVALAGAPGQNVLISASIGKLAPGLVTLDATGAGTATLTACRDLETGCSGAIELTAKTGALMVGQAVVALTVPPIAAAAACDVAGSVAVVDGITHGEVHVTAHPDQLEFTADGGTTGRFDLIQLLAPLAPGSYEQATRNPGTGQPGLDVSSGGVGCNQVQGRYQIVRYTASEVTGEVTDALFGYELLCDSSPTIRTGCFHYAATATPPPTPPVPDPAKVAITATLGATAIFRDPAGNVIADVAVDSFGFAQATVPAGGEVSVIEDSDGTLISTYRDVQPGDAIVVHPPQVASGAEDDMLASFTPPAGATSTTLLTACGGGSGGNLPDTTYLAFFDGCRTDSFGMLSTATVPGQPPQYIWQPALHHAANGNVVVAGTWAPMASVVVHLTNLPAGTPRLSLSWAVQLGRTAHSFGDVVFTQPVGSAQTVLTVPPNVGDGETVEVTDVSLLAGDVRTVSTTSTPAAVVIDYATLPVPVVTNLVQDGAGASWSQSAGGADTRVVFWRAILSNGQRVSEVIYEPAIGTSSALPALPVAHAAIDPTRDSGAMLTGTGVNLTDYDVLAGYATNPPTHDFASHMTAAETIQLTFPQ